MTNKQHANWTLRCAIGLAVLTAIVFSRVLDCGYINFDDQEYVISNSVVHDGLSWAAIGRELVTMRLALWHPLTFISLMADTELFGDNAKGHHAMNLALHVANVVLVLLLMATMTRSTWRSAALAAIFAVHPLRVESVAWVAERKDVLSLFFILLALHAYLFYVRRPSVLRYLLVVGGMVCSLMAKPMFVTLPFLLLLLDYWPLRRLSVPDSDSAARSRQASLRWLVIEKFPLVAISLACLALTLSIHLPNTTVKQIHDIAVTHKVNWYLDYPLSLRLENALITTVRYIGKMVDFRHLVIFYPMPSIWPISLVIASAGLLIAVSGIVTWRRRERPWLFVGWFWYLGTLVPILGILVQVGQYAMADRYTYFPTIGLLIMLFWSIPERWVQNKEWRMGLGAGLGAAIVVLCIATYTQIGYWTNSATVFQHAVNVIPDNPQAHMNLAVTLLYDVSDFKGARDQAREVLRERPGQRDASAILGMALEELGDPKDAEQVYRAALTYHAGDDGLLVELGKSLSQQGKSAEAIACFKRAINLYPDNPYAYKGLGIEAARHGDMQGAVKNFSLSLSMNPKDAQVQKMLDRAIAERDKGIDPAPSIP